jgi:hypothetical protein
MYNIKNKEYTDNKSYVNFTFLLKVYSLSLYQIILTCHL